MQLKQYQSVASIESHQQPYRTHDWTEIFYDTKSHELSSTECILMKVRDLFCSFLDENHIKTGQRLTKVLEVLLLRNQQHYGDHNR